MRKLHKEKIKEQLDILLEAVGELKKNSNISLYNDIKEFVSSICNYIEKMAGSQTQTVKILKDFSEKLEISDAAELQKIIKKVNYQAKLELKVDRIEIVFFCYKASMADCLETVYLAAKADPFCDAYFVPIPYFERDTDGKFKDVKWEGINEYPSHFDLTDWRKYTLEERRPDAIFVMNPYDESNFITTVHPNFFCKRLREFTDCLCYIPYFVHQNNSNNYIEKHFITSPGTVYANKVFLENENVCEQYINIFSKEFGTQFGRAQNKFVALGSPKFDAIKNAKKDYFNLPDEWLKLIKKADDTQKKVVFYNTTIAGILNNNEVFLEKLNFVLNTFKERDDVVLWWRPHPLTLQTLDSMRPEIVDDYKEIIAKYKRENYGIFDDTSEFHRAIIWSDAYYGDHSSAHELYKETGKPLMMQNYEILNYDKKSYNLKTRSYFVIGEKIYFIPMNYNFLLCYDKTTKTTDIVSYFPNEKEYLPRSGHIFYNDIAQIGKQLYFAPLFANEIASFDLEKNEFSKYYFAPKSIDLSAFLSVNVYNEFVYFTPLSYNSIAELNTLTGEIKYYNEPIKLLKSIDKSLTYFNMSQIVQNSIWLSSVNINAVIQFDLVKKHSKIHRINSNNTKFSGIKYDGENFWLIPTIGTTEPLTKWNPEKGIIKEFTEIYKDDAFHGFDAVYFDDFLWLLPRNSTHAYKINVKTNVVSIAEEFEIELNQKNFFRIKYIAPKVFNDSIFAFKWLKNELVEYNVKTNKKTVHILKIDEIPLDRNALFKNANDIIFETDFLNLQKFLDFIITQNTVIEQRQEVSSGGKIYDYISDYLTKNS